MLQWSESETWGGMEGQVHVEDPGTGAGQAEQGARAELAGQEEPRTTTVEQEPSRAEQMGQEPTREEQTEQDPIKAEQEDLKHRQGHKGEVRVFTADVVGCDRQG
ncbi:hypothetical protein QQF64_022387 [Cirrhinus molitorella]|uniref:Uncharacterized protein n=1 Tax=Cirrhinus molitorella TaxID=172907 RepID=A0ABR3LBK8_9TELE